MSGRGYRRGIILKNVLHKTLKKANACVFLHGVCFFGFNRIKVFKKGKTDCHSRLHGFAMTGEGEQIATCLTAVSPAGSVGASASQ